MPVAPSLDQYMFSLFRVVVRFEHFSDSQINFTQLNCCQKLSCSHCHDVTKLTHGLQVEVVPESIELWQVDIWVLNLQAWWGKEEFQRFIHK